MPKYQTSLDQLLLKANQHWDGQLGDVRKIVALANNADIPPTDAAGVIQDVDGLGEQFVALIGAVNNDKRKAKNAREAITAAGPKNALVLAAATHLLHRLEKRSQFLNHVVLSATWAKLIGREFGRRDIEFLFLAAVAQPIGIELIRHTAPEVYAQIDPYSDDVIGVFDMETRHLGINHQVVGSEFLKNWGFPDSVCLAVARSNDFEANNVDFRNRGFCRTISFATHIANTWRADPDRVRLDRLANEAHQYLGLQTSQFAELWADALNQVPKLNVALGLPDWPNPSLQEFAIKAHRTLAGPAAATSIRHSQKTTHVESIGDFETAVLDQQSFERRLADELTMSIRYDWPMAVGLVKIEHSDTGDWGTSDRAMRAAHEVLNGILRVSDAAGSIGPSEIAILLPAALPEESASIMQGIEKGIVNRIRQFSNQGLPCSDIRLGLVNRTTDCQFSNGHEAIAIARATLKNIVSTVTEDEDRSLSSVV